MEDAGGALCSGGILGYTLEDGVASGGRSSSCRTLLSGVEAAEEFTPVSDGWGRHCAVRVAFGGLSGVF